MSIADDVLKSLGKEPKKRETPAPTDKLPDNKIPDDKKPDDKKPDPPAVVEITDDLLLGELKKRGFNLDKVDQITVKGPAEPTEAEKAEAIKKKKEAANNYAITNGIYSMDDYVSYEKDRDRPASEIAYELFKNDFLEGIKGTAEEDTFKDEDIRELYDERNFASEKDDSPKKKVVTARQEKVKNSYLQNKYGKILNAENVFTDYEKEIARATQYKGIVDNAISKIPQKLKYNVAGVDVEFQPSAEALQYIKDVYLHPKAYLSVGADATEDSLKEAIEFSIAQKDLPRLLQESAETYHEAKLKTLKLGRIGVRPDRTDGTSLGNVTTDSKTSNADKIIEEQKKK